MLFKLKFLIYKNLGTIARDRGDHSTAVDAYIQVGTSDLDLSPTSSSCPSPSLLPSLPPSLPPSGGGH